MPTQLWLRIRLAKQRRNFLWLSKVIKVKYSFLFHVYTLGKYSHIYFSTWFIMLYQYRADPVYLFMFSSLVLIYFSLFQTDQILPEIWGPRKSTVTTLSLPGMNQKQTEDVPSQNTKWRNVMLKNRHSSLQVNIYSSNPTTKKLKHKLGIRLKILFLFYF